MDNGKIVFNICHPGEPNAGIRSYSDKITIIVDSDNPGGEPGEFEQFMRECVETWFDGAKVIKNDLVQGMSCRTNNKQPDVCHMCGCTSLGDGYTVIPGWDESLCSTE